MAVELLSRIQFGFSIGFHILFPTLNLGLAIFLVVMEMLWLKTKEPAYLEICKFWTKIFGLEHIGLDLEYSTLSEGASTPKIRASKEWLAGPYEIN